MPEIFIQYSNEAEARCDYSTEHQYIKQFLPSLSSSCVMGEFCTVTRQGAYLEIKDALGKTKATHVDKLVMSRHTNIIR